MVGAPAERGGGGLGSRNVLLACVMFWVQFIHGVFFTSSPG